MMVLAFWALLRVDELVKVRLGEIEVKETITGHILVITLPFRKTTSKEHVIVLHPMPRNPEICPVTSYMRYRKTLHDIGHGSENAFINYTKRGLIANSDLSKARFFSLFKDLLDDLDVADAYNYGSHSFRRGGAQFFNTVFKMSIKDICEFGGWSFIGEVSVIGRYLVGPFDDPLYSSEDRLAAFTRATSIEAASHFNQNK